jgi:hypothetical protein
MDCGPGTRRVTLCHHNDAYSCPRTFDDLHISESPLSCVALARAFSCPDHATLTGGPSSQRQLDFNSGAAAITKARG